ncbi:hypothetical protein [Peribacillus frigoritolerans]|uniref:hypothetical protein n=1 Tax=Peribacillus frigoritolerans TaxID=450367 RepID=UPI002E1EC8DF|nr:hypothetical protein [Peribacillus frigoritolerans]MED3845548.1 hypothetical protein [Peribacillus frigoritolerans]
MKRIEFVMSILVEDGVEVGLLTSSIADDAARAYEAIKEIEYSVAGVVYGEEKTE